MRVLVTKEQNKKPNTIACECGAVFEYDESVDIKITPFSYDNSLYRFTVQCPECKEHHYVAAPQEIITKYGRNK